MFQRSPERLSPRLPWWNYSSAAYYFVTICTKNMTEYFGAINPDGYRRSSLYYIAKKSWLDIPRRHPFAGVYDFVVMPNHIHGIVEIYPRPDAETLYGRESNTAGTQHIDTGGSQRVATLQCMNRFGPQRQNLATVVSRFKSAVTIAAHRHGFEFAWQSRYHERIIWDDAHLFNVRQYIHRNVEAYRDKIMKF